MLGNLLTDEEEFGCDRVGILPAKAEKNMEQASDQLRSFKDNRKLQGNLYIQPPKQRCHL